MSSTNHSYEAELCRVDETSAEIQAEVLAEMKAEHQKERMMDTDRPTLSSGRPADQPFGLGTARRGSPSEVRKQREKGIMNYIETDRYIEETEKYVRSLRNRSKREYAEALLVAHRAGWLGETPQRPKDLSAMGAQAVDLAFSAIRRNVES